MKITKDNFLIKVCLLFAFVFVSFNVLMAGPVLADALLEKQIGIGTTGELGEAFGESGTVDQVRDVRIVLAEAVKVFLGFMGIVFLILIVYAGVTWMTAAGQEDKVNKAKSLLVASVIGLIIVLSSFAVAKLLTDKLYMATVIIT